MTASDRTQQPPIPIDEAPTATITDDRVKSWTQTVEIPTYPTGEPTPHPMYFDGRVYQGSSGRVYPLPVIETVGDAPRPVAYEAVFLENRYVKLMILPQLGGRIHMAYDKLRDYHFVYFNRVIKPALVGLAGPWVSGGIEFNWPQHHRPSTYLPIEYTLPADSDDEARVVLGEIDRMRGLQVTTSIGLRKDDARIHIATEVSNPTSLAQTFLWWANPAVAVNEDYQATFPPDVRAVFDHGKRDVSRFPVATGTYYKTDYSHGVNISFYRNIPVPTSYMAHYSRQDFVGGYDHGARAGLLHSAANRYSPGKKMWTWGTADFGQAWERNLTDEDGPYVELMTGIYTDNQPDFTWIMPGEAKQFTQVFYPYAGLSSVLAANENAAFTLEHTESGTLLRVYAPRPVSVAPVISTAEQTVTLEAKDAGPQAVTEWRLPDGERESLSITLNDEDGQSLLTYSAERTHDLELPDSAVAPAEPARVATAEQLYLIGLHLEQNRHATWDPEEYYREALRRDAHNWRANTAMARRCINRNRPEKAREYAERAVRRLCEWNSNPESGWAHYYLGQAAMMSGDRSGAREAYEKASWALDARPAALYELAADSVAHNELNAAVALLEECCDIAPRFERARSLYAIVLRLRGEDRQAEDERASILNRNPLSYVTAVEGHFASSSVQMSPGEAGLSADDWDRIWIEILGSSDNRFIDLLCDYRHAGLTQEMEILVGAYEAWHAEAHNPLPYYLVAHATAESHYAVRRTVDEWLRLASTKPIELVFPVRLDVLRALEFACSQPAPPLTAHYLLGNAEYDRGNHGAAGHHWKEAAGTMPEYPTVHRNIALYTFNHEDRPREALEAMERACALAPSDGRLLLELDELYKRLGRGPHTRREMMEKHASTIASRDDLTIRYAEVLTSTAAPSVAVPLFARRRFHPWEGGEGAVPAAYRRALIRSALESFVGGESASALEQLRAAKEYPENLGEGRLPNASDNEIDFWIGVVHEEAGEAEAARSSFELATKGQEKPALSLYYNDVPARSILYQGLAWRRTGDEKSARRCFFGLRDHADMHQHDKIDPDYFAVSLPDLVTFDYDLSERNRVFCTVLRALSFIGLGHDEAAHSELKSALESDPNNPDALDHIVVLDSLAQYLTT